MPYATNASLPSAVRRVLPEHAQYLYRAAFNEALACGGLDPEAAAHRLAWAAVKRSYVQRAPGLWERRRQRV
jgi:cation transport regulator